MPDVSNKDLMKLIHRVLKKVDQIEEKLNVLLEGKNSNYQMDEEEYKNSDYDFKYTPIENDEDLDRVSIKIEKDEHYKRNLVKKLKRSAQHLSLNFF